MIDGLELESRNMLKVRDMQQEKERDYLFCRSGILTIWCNRQNERPSKGTINSITKLNGQSGIMSTNPNNNIRQKEKKQCW
jgi:hypothetical protein